MEQQYKSSLDRRKSWAAHRARNLEKRREATRVYRRNNPEKVKASNKKANLARKTSLKWRLGYTLRNRTRLAIKNNQKVGSAVLDLGCTVDQLKVYLESKFLPGMTWKNWSRAGWHIDHIIPLKFFDLSNKEQFKKACHFSNLQPLWAVDNLRKG